MTGEERNRPRQAGDGRPLGIRPRLGILPTTVFLIMFLGLSLATDDTHTPQAAAPAPTSQVHSPSQLERAKSILGVTDQISDAPPLPSHSHKSQNIRRIISSIKKDFLAEKSSSEATTLDTPTETTTASPVNQGLIRSILRAVSREGSKKEKTEEEEQPSPAFIEEDAGKEDAQTEECVDEEEGHRETEEKTTSKKKFSKVISEVVLSGDDTPAPLETPSSMLPPAEEVKEEVAEEVHTEQESSSSKRSHEDTVVEVEEQKTDIVSVESVSGDDSSSDSIIVSEEKETDSEVHDEIPAAKEEEEEKVVEELITAPPATTEGDAEGVPPMGSGIEVMTKALGAVDVEVDVAPGNSSINPVSTVNGRRSIFSRKSEVTLSHIFGAKEFLQHFPSENFTHLRTHRPGHSKPFQKDTKASEETQAQHKSESALKEESNGSVDGEAVIDSEPTRVPGGVKELSSSSIPTKPKEKKDRKETQVRLESEVVSHAADTVGESVTEVGDGKWKKKPKVDEGTQQNEALGQVESTQEADAHLQPSLDDVEAEVEMPHPSEIADSVKVEAEKVAETHQTPSDASKSLEEPTQEIQSTESLSPVTESKNVSEPAIKAEEEQKAMVKEESKAEELPEKVVKEQANMTEKGKEAVVSAETEEAKVKPAAVDVDAAEEGAKKKKKPSESEKPKKKEAADKSADAKQGEKEKAADTLETYSQFTQRVNAEKKNDIMTNGHGTNGHGKGPKVKSKNYASPDCGSKLLMANPEATHASKVIHSNKDEYLLNKCRDKTWFIIELCESIRPQKFDIANFELFSNLPKDIHVLGSHRYPSRDWTSLGSAQGQEGNRGVQSFPVETEDFFKYIKVEVHSHYGHEYFCPISLFRIYGLSEFEVIDTVEDSEEPEEAEIFIESQPDEKKVKDEGKPSVIPAVIKNMFTGVLDVIKRGYRPHTSTSESGDHCYTLQPTHTVDKRSCQLADSLNYILSCYHTEYQMLMQTSFVSNTVKNSGFCRLLASTMCLAPEVSDSVVYDTVCNSSYLCIMLSPKHLLAMCFMHDSRIVNTQVECESAGTLLPENFSATTPPILPTEKRMPSYVKNAKINTSTITRTDATLSHMNGPAAATQAEEWSDQSSGVKQIPMDPLAVGQEEPAASPSSDAVIAEPSKPKKPKPSGSGQDQVVREEQQPDNKTEPEEGVAVEGASTVRVEISEEESVKEEEEKHEEEHPHPVTPLPVETKLSSTSPTNKESVVVRLSNKIKALEYNMSISSQYLEELSRRYKSQMEEMQRQFNLTIAALNATSRQAFERDQHHQRDIEMLEEQLASVTAILRKLVEERESLAHTVVEQHLLLMVVEVVVLCVVFVLCYKRTTRHRLLELQGQERRAQTPSEDPSDRQGLGSGNSLSGWTRGRMRRRSVDSITRERSSHQRRCRRPSEEALRISGTYEDLLIIEPAIPIMVDSVSDRKKKRKSSSGVLKRSKSNASIVEKFCSSTKRSQRLENLDMSSAGVLFCGDQVETKGVSHSPQVDPASLQFSGDTVDSPVSADAISSRSYVEEVMSAPHPHHDINAVTSKKHSSSCSQNSENLNRNWGKLTKSHSLSCSSEKLKNGAEKKKKKLKKRNNTIQEAQQPYTCSHEAELYPETNRTSYNGLSEHNPEYYYNGRSSVHFSETSDSLGNHMFGADVTNGSSYVNGDSSQDLGYVGSEYMHSSYMTNYSEKRRTSPAAKVKLRSDNWEWYSLQHFGSSSETVSTCSDSSGKTRKVRHDDVPHTQDQSDDKKVKKKKKGKSRAPVLLEEETNGGT